MYSIKIRSGSREGTILRVPGKEGAFQNTASFNQMSVTLEPANGTRASCDRQIFRELGISRNTTEEITFLLVISDLGNEVEYFVLAGRVDQLFLFDKDDPRIPEHIATYGGKVNRINIPLASEILTRYQFDG